MGGEGKRDKQSSATKVLASAALCTLMIYALSIGPVIGLASRGYLGDGTISSLQRFYAPLQYLQDHSTIAARCFHSYALCLFRSARQGNGRQSKAKTNPPELFPSP